MEAIQAAWTPEKRNAERLVAELAAQWEAPMAAMARAGRAFAGLEAVLGGDAFSLQVKLDVPCRAPSSAQCWRSLACGCAACLCWVLCAPRLCRV